MDQEQTISELGECVITEIERLQYAPLTIQNFRSDVRHLAAFIRQRTGAEFFSEKLGAGYLCETIGFPFETPHLLMSVEGKRIRCVRRIGEYQLCGAVLRNHLKKEKILDDWELGDEKIIAVYVKSVQTADNNEATKKLRLNHIRQFYEFLAA